MTSTQHGKNYGTYVTLSKQTDAQLLRSIKSYSKNIVEHYNKIENPSGYVEDWINRNDRYREGIIKKWEKDIARNMDQLEIAQGIATERRLRYE